MTVDFWTWFVAFLIIAFAVIGTMALFEIVRVAMTLTYKSGDHYRRNVLWRIQHALRGRATYLLTFLPRRLRHAYFRWSHRQFARELYSSSFDAARMADEGMITSTTGAVAYGPADPEAADILPPQTTVFGDLTTHRVLVNP